MEIFWECYSTYGKIGVRTYWYERVKKAHMFTTIAHLACTLCFESTSNYKVKVHAHTVTGIGHLSEKDRKAWSGKPQQYVVPGVLCSVLWLLVAVAAAVSVSHTTVFATTRL